MKSAVKDAVVDNPFYELSELIGQEETHRHKIDDPYDFVFNYAFTLDPHDPVCPVKKIPDCAYVRNYIKFWLENSNLLLVKSRQMMITWVSVALNLWLAMTQEGQYIFFISKKEDDANFSSQLSLLSRAFFIYNHLPKELQIKYHKKEQPAMLIFTGKNSTIHGVSQDSDALRQYTTSSLFFDEMAFQENSEKSFASIKPTLDGYKKVIAVAGGHKLILPKFCGVSTPNGKRNLFSQLVHDESI
jgi:phage FluMu gp28-like protein